MNEPRLLQGEYAGFVTRAIAFGLDTAIVTGLAAALSWILTRPLQLIGIDLTTCSLESLSVGGSISEVWCLVYIFGLPVAIGLTIVGYYVLFWTLTGWTIGKGVMGIRVVRADGTRLGVGRSLLRYFGYVLSLVPLGAGFFWVLISNSRQGWHDKIAGTYVLYSWEARESDMFLSRLGRYAHEAQVPHSPLAAGGASLAPANASIEVEVIETTEPAPFSGQTQHTAE